MTKLEIQCIGYVAERFGNDDNIFETWPAIRVDGKSYITRGLNWHQDLDEIEPIESFSDLNPPIGVIPAKPRIINEMDSVWVIGERAWSILKITSPDPTFERNNHFWTRSAPREQFAQFTNVLSLKIEERILTASMENTSFDETDDYLWGLLGRLATMPKLHTQLARALYAKQASHQREGQFIAAETVHFYKLCRNLDEFEHHLQKLSKGLSDAIESVRRSIARFNQIPTPQKSKFDINKLRDAKLALSELRSRERLLKSGSRRAAPDFKTKRTNSGQLQSPDDATQGISFLPGRDPHIGIKRRTQNKHTLAKIQSQSIQHEKQSLIKEIILMETIMFKYFTPKVELP